MKEKKTKINLPKLLFLGFLTSWVVSGILLFGMLNNLFNSFLEMLFLPIYWISGLNYANGFQDSTKILLLICSAFLEVYTIVFLSFLLAKVLGGHRMNKRFKTKKGFAEEFALLGLVVGGWLLVLAASFLYGKLILSFVVLILGILDNRVTYYTLGFICLLVSAFLFVYILNKKKSDLV